MWQPVAQFFWTTNEDPHFNDKRYLNFPVKPDGKWHEYEVPVATHEQWHGKAIRAIRLDPTTGGARAGDRVEIDWIVGVPPPSEWRRRMSALARDSNRMRIAPCCSRKGVLELAKCFVWC